MTEQPRTRRSRERPPTEPCTNCGDATVGRFCPSCGQRKTDVRASVAAILEDVAKDEFVLNAALPRTVVSLLFRPGHLTQEYVRGRIVRYIPPLRLYLAASIVFFVVISFIGLRTLDRMDVDQSSLPSDPDSARVVLQQRHTELQNVDTTTLPPAARAMLRQTLLTTTQALDALGDSAGAADAAALRQARLLDDGAVHLPQGMRQQWARDITVSGAPSWVEAAVERKLDQIGHLPPRDAFRAIVSDMLSFAPHMVFLMLPVFALLLKLLYIRRDRFYAEHVVFALHVHAFFFLMFLIMLLVPWGTVDGLIIIWTMLYVWLAMRRVYQQGWFRTTVKWGVLGWCYMFVLTFGMVGLMLSTLWL
jgi:hypothetical protein